MLKFFIYNMLCNLQNDLETFCKYWPWALSRVQPVLVVQECYSICVLLEGRKNKSNDDNQYCELLFDKNQEKINYYLNLIYSLD